MAGPYPWQNAETMKEIRARAEGAPAPAAKPAPKRTRPTARTRAPRPAPPPEPPAEPEDEPLDEALRRRIEASFRRSPDLIDTSVIEGPLEIELPLYRGNQVLLTPENEHMAPLVEARGYVPVPVPSEEEAAPFIDSFVKIQIDDPVPPPSVPTSRTAFIPPKPPGPIDLSRGVARAIPAAAAAATYPARFLGSAALASAKEAGTRMQQDLDEFLWGEDSPHSAKGRQKRVDEAIEAALRGKEK